MATKTTIIEANWHDVMTAKELGKVLREGVRRLREIGRNEMADEWTRRLGNMPKKMSKEAINYVLYAATKEVENALGE